MLTSLGSPARLGGIKNVEGGFPYHVVVLWLEGQRIARTDVLTFPFQLANHREHGIAILSQLQEIEDEAVGSVRHLRLTVGIRLYNQDMVGG